MTRFWSMRDELYSSLHQWPTITIFCLAGCFVGWALAYLWPASYKAIAQVYVGLNPYRAYSDSHWLALAKPRYSNIDDYKNWQMSELSSAIFLDEVIQDTLVKLQGTDPYWVEINEVQLRSMLDAEWRSAGEWSLVAENGNSEYASQAAQIWSDLVVEHVQKAVEEAQNTILVDDELQKVQDELLRSELRYAELEDALITLNTWLEIASYLPEDRPLELTEHWNVLSVVNGFAKFTPGWLALLNDQPTQSSVPEEYITWISKVLIFMENEKLVISKRIESLAEQKSELSEQYKLVSGGSLGLSPNLVIEDLKIIPPKPIRPTGILLTIGGIAGFSIWVLMQLIRITQVVQNSE